MEEFIDILGWEGYYQISSHGRIKSLDRYVKSSRNKIRINKGRILKQYIDINGYARVQSGFNKKRIHFIVHQQVAIAFLGHKPCGYKIIVDHIDNDKLNNHLSNLQLISPRLNTSKDRWRYNHSSKYVGVCWNKSNKKWQANIRIKSKLKHLGYFKSEIKASEAYQHELSFINN